MSAKKLRSKFDLSSLKFILPLRGSPRPPLGISPDFSDKMFRRTTKSSHRQVEGPPPPPPKDTASRHYSFYGPRADWDDVQYAVMASPISENPSSHPGLPDPTQVLIISHQVRSPPPPRYSRLPPVPDEMGAMHLPSSPAVPPKSKFTHAHSLTSRIPVAAGRAPPVAPRRRVATISSPEEAEVRRRDAQRRKELEEAEAIREEQQRQARLKYEKQQLLMQAALEEEERKAALEAELRRAADERRKREAIEHEAEELTKMVAAERKRQDRERRRTEARRLSEERRQLERERREQEEMRRSSRQHVAEERRALAALLETRKTKNSRGLSVLLTGWLTVQSEDYLSYKRRYFHLREDALLLFKDTEDDSKPLETIQLSRIQGVREADDGYEDLQAIKNSFALELRDVYDPWTMFSDSNEDKEKLLALLTSRLTTR